MPLGSDILNQKGDILSKLGSILSLLDLEDLKKNRENLNKWKALFSDLRDTFGNITENQIAFMLVIIKIIKSRSRKEYRADESEEKTNMWKQSKKQKRSEKRKERADRRAATKQNISEKLKPVRDALDSEYAKVLKKIIKQAISNVIPTIPDIIIQEILRSFNCDLSTEVPVVGDGLDTDIIIRIDQVDLFNQLKQDPEVGVGKYCYEANKLDLGGIPFPYQKPFPMNRFLRHITENPNTRFQVPGASGKRLFSIMFDGVDSFVISPHYKGANNATVFSQIAPDTPSFPGNGVKFTIAELLKDYFYNIKVIELQNLLGAMLEINAGIGFSFSNDGDTNYADKLGINKLIGILNKFIVACDGLDLGEISTDTISHLQELVDDDDYFNFTASEEKNFYVEAERKRAGVMKFASCDNIEIPLDPEIFQDAADEIMASIVKGGTGTEQLLMILQTGVEGSITKHTGDTFKELDWNWNVHFMQELVINFPLILVLSLMSTKVILPMVLVAVIVNNTTLLAANPAEFMKLFKRVFVRICRAILKEVLKIVFKILKQFLVKLLIIYIKMLLATQKGKRIKMILSLIAALLPFIADLNNAKNCKEILMIIMKMIAATGIDIPFSPPPKFLQFAAMARSGTNSLRTFEKLTVKLENLGIPTGDMPDGTPNLFMLSQFALADAMDEEETVNGVVHGVLFPTIANGPPGSVLVRPTKVVGLKC
tara:strand:+ start:357 stop:2492 length:2136 start_codon:yes stop_codon:yes gene_type:complete